MSLFRIAVVLFAAVASQAQTVDTVKVVSRRVDRTIRLPGEFLPYQSVDLRARVSGFVEKVNVDRGSVVKEGDLLVTLTAPEMAAQVAEAEAKAQAQESQRAEAAARVVAEESTYERLKTASSTRGAIAANELVQAEKALDAARAAVRAAEMSVKAAHAAVAVLKEQEAYLKVTAPFDGVITERYAHPGALAGPGAGSAALLKIEQIARLRLVVAVPEADVAGIVRGARVRFSVPAYPGEVFSAVVARVSHSMDVNTRTMPVELDAPNPRRLLAPGMYPEVRWPVREPRQSLLVPPACIVTTTERSFVIRVEDGRARWIDVRRGDTAGELVEVFGALKAGDLLVLRASDEIREGTRLTTRAAARN